MDQEFRLEKIDEIEIENLLNWISKSKWINE